MMKPILMRGSFLAFFWFIVVILTVVFIHELGHFLFARLFGVHVEKFSIGFGPSILSFTDGRKTKWALSAVPLGGYVKLHGYEFEFDKHADEKIDALSTGEKQAIFPLKPLWQKALIVFAGPAFNYLLAIMCFCMVFAISGVPTYSAKVSDIKKDSIAAKIGLLPGDIILEINGNRLTTGIELKQYLAETANPISLNVMRDNQVQKLLFSFAENEDRVLGVTFFPVLEKMGFIASSQAAVKTTYAMSKLMIIGVFEIISGKIGTEHIGGPIKIAEYSAAAAHTIESFLWFIAVISLNLGLINLLPIPALDGGHLFFYMLEAINGGKLNKTFKIFCLKVGFAILAFIMIFAISNDIRGFIK